MAGEGASIRGSHTRDLYSANPHHPNNNQATALKIIVVVSGIAIFWGLGITSNLVPQIFATSQVQIFSTAAFAGAGLFTGIAGFSAIALTTRKNAPQRTDVYESLRRNTRTAFKDHRVNVARARLIFDHHATSLTFHHQAHAIQGTRETMEDVSFCVDLPIGKLAGVFDGHYGIEVAKLAAQQFPLVFPAKLEETKGDVEKAFRETFQAIQEQIKGTEIESQRTLVKQFFSQQGTDPEQEVSPGATASVVYIPESNVAFVATLGDTHTFAFEKRTDRTQVYPLSPVLNWACPQEARRAGAVVVNTDYQPYYFLPEVVTELKEINKGLRSPISRVNVSRALGNIRDQAISQEPVVTMMQLNKETILLIGCDGVWDFVKKPKDFIRNVIEKHWDSPANIANATVDYAYEHESDDNISALVLWAKR
ncbi:MAG: hypothetical protein KR126chlam2_01104 [Chlamydiae bacterium]|nr:hypothetical protein [Chlamydiota bacterium]